MKSIKRFFKKVIKKILNKTYFLRSIYKKVKFLKNKTSYWIRYKRVKTDEHLVIFESFFTSKYACSPKAIYEYMSNNPEYKDYKYIWAFKKPKNESKYFEGKDNVTLVKYNSKTYYRSYMQAKYWVTNTRLPECIIKKDDQVYVQCWHGTPLKRLGYDIQVKGNNKLHSSKDLKRTYNNDAKRYTYMISPSKFCSEKLTSAFNLENLGKKDIIIEEGYPRNDELFKFDDKYVQDIKKQLEIPLDKKIILYAPTWRDDQHQLGVGYTFDIGLDLDKLREKIGNEYVLLTRLHYLVASQLDFEKYEGFIFDVSKYDNINDLYIISDILITDYSSVFFDYANLKRPILFYMYDLEKYKNNSRDFYFDLDELPGPIIEKEEDVLKSILNIEQIKEEYKEKYKKFNAKFNYLDDANASKRVVERIFKK